MNPLAWLNPTRWLLLAGIVAALVLGVPFLWHRHIEVQQRIGYDRRADEDRQAADAQARRMRDLQRAAELRYTVQAGVREKFLTVTVVKEIRDASAPLAACPVPEPAVRLLNAARECAGGDTPAACGPGDGVPAAR